MIKSFWRGLFRHRSIAIWEATGALFINMLGGFLHFAFELSGYNRTVALIASVNESTWEHLKFYFWSGIIFSLIEYTYVKDKANNFVYAKAMGLLVTALVIPILFYGYLSVALPMFGKGNLPTDITTGVIGVIAGQMVSSYLMQREKLPVARRRIGTALMTVMLFMFATFTYFPPKLFLFEDYSGYTYRGEYGILDEYTPFFIAADE